MTLLLDHRTLETEADLQQARSSIRAGDQRTELRLGQTVSVYEFPSHRGAGQITIWHDTGSAAIDLGDGSLWGYWDEDNETILVDDGDYTRKQFNTSGECIAEFKR